MVKPLTFRNDISVDTNKFSYFSAEGSNRMQLFLKLGLRNHVRSFASFCTVFPARPSLLLPSCIFDKACEEFSSSGGKSFGRSSLKTVVADSFNVNTLVEDELTSLHKIHVGVWEESR